MIDDGKHLTLTIALSLAVAGDRSGAKAHGLGEASIGNVNFSNSDENLIFSKNNLVISQIPKEYFNN